MVEAVHLKSLRARPDRKKKKNTSLIMNGSKPHQAPHRQRLRRMKDGTGEISDIGWDSLSEQEQMLNED